MEIISLLKTFDAVDSLKIDPKASERLKLRDSEANLSELGNSKNIEVSEDVKVGRPPIDIIRTESLQQLVEENRSKLSEPRNDLEMYFQESENIQNTDYLDEGYNSVDENEVNEIDIEENQRAAISDAFKMLTCGEKFTNEELGNLGEMMMDQYYLSQGYTPLNISRVTGLDDKKGGFKTGIDGVYEKTNMDGSKSFVIADAKYNTSQLSETTDGKQMSDNWIEKRLDNAVGKEKADEIRDAFEDDPNSISTEVYHIDPRKDENIVMHTDIQNVDSEGNKVGKKIVVEYFDASANRINLLNHNRFEVQS